MKKTTRFLTPFVFWSHWFYRRFFKKPPREPLATFPKELLPLLEVGTLVMRYCQFANTAPEHLEISKKLEALVNQHGDAQSLRYLGRVLTTDNLLDVTYDWLVSLGDALEEDRERFCIFLADQKPIS